jgi:serine/threonine protein kinase
LTSSLPVERVIDKRYRLDKLIGQGGMGAVYEGTDLRLNRRVAIKILRGSMFGDRTAQLRFEHEARTCARLSHPNIITVHDYGVLGMSGAYLVMELVTGETLRALLKRKRLLDPVLAASLLNQGLEALKAAHSAGVVHRDLKPENMLIVRSNGQDQLKILDFGLAKLTHSVVADSQSPTMPAALTSPGMAVGTVGYMAPEQLMGGAASEQTDLFSFGVVVVEVLTGQLPFTGITYHDVMTKILQHTYHLPVHSEAGQHLDDVLQRCLAKDPMARFSSAAELQSQLIPALHDCPSTELAPDSTGNSATRLFEK